jgi:hypothetical protein
VCGFYLFGPLCRLGTCCWEHESGRSGLIQGSEFVANLKKFEVSKKRCALFG